MTRINKSKTSGWYLPPKRDANLLHFLFLLGFGIFSLHFMDVRAVLTLCDGPLWDEIRKETASHGGKRTGDSLPVSAHNWDIRGYINMLSLGLRCPYPCHKIHRIRGSMADGVCCLLPGGQHVPWLHCVGKHCRICCSERLPSHRHWVCFCPLLQYYGATLILNIYIDSGD